MPPYFDTLIISLIMPLPLLFYALTRHDTIDFSADSYAMLLPRYAMMSRLLLMLRHIDVAYADATLPIFHAAITFAAAYAFDARYVTRCLRCHATPAYELMSRHAVHAAI